MHDGSAYGRGLAETVRAALRRLGVRDSAFEAYLASQGDYAALVQKLKTSGAAAVYIGGYDRDAGLIVRQSHQAGFRPQFVAGDALVSDEFWRVAGAAGEGVMMTFVADPRESPDARAVVAQFRARGVDPEGYTIYAYAAVEVWARAVERAKSVGVDAIAAAMRGDCFRSVLGRVCFDAKGDLSTPAYVWFRWSQGRYATVK